METSRKKEFVNDAELRERWRCSDMKLWRLRNAGKLPKPIKIGGTGRNLTPLEAVEAMEHA